ARRAEGSAEQLQRLNSDVVGGPSFGLVSEPRAQELESIVKIDYDRSFAVGAKVGVGADYKFKSFFLGGEVGYMRHFTKLQGRPFHAVTILFGLKSDITRLGEKVVEIIAPSAIN